ncbi:MAG TPA: hypothetical protein VHV29_02570 [Terriglobales bacterium]|jgi:hypothetical protein|nr:hypothetical protein [Terriglobales bacterium]
MLTFILEKPTLRFRAEQLVPRPLDEVFDFFSRAENLQPAAWAPTVRCGIANKTALGWPS